MATRRTGKSQGKRAGKVAGAAIFEMPSNHGSTANGATAKPANGSPCFEDVQRRAYELYLARGAMAGNDWGDWFIAESELSSGSHLRKD
jgi:DUF2934 family protein